MSAPSPAREPAPGEASSRDPANWAADIVTLHEAGHLDAAAEALREFRAKYRDADLYLPRSLSAWARSVQ
jgi:hypothetical protein